MGTVQLTSMSDLVAIFEEKKPINLL